MSFSEGFLFAVAQNEVKPLMFCPRHPILIIKGMNRYRNSIGIIQKDNMDYNRIAVGEYQDCVTYITYKVHMYTELHQIKL